MTNREKNEQSAIIWNVLFECEAIAIVNHWQEHQKAQYIKNNLPPKSKKWAYKSLKRVANSGNITAYIDAIGSKLIEDTKGQEEKV